MNFSKNKETINGTVLKITYRNENNGYTVLILDADGENLTAVGIMPFINEGDTLKCVGEFKNHITYGEQFSVEQLERIVNTDSASLLRYLSGGSIKGVGPATARAIVERFGEDSLDIIENSPEKLAEIRGVSYSKAVAINKEYAKQHGMRDIMMLLSCFGVSPEEVMRIYKTYGEQSLDKIKSDPYLLCSDNIGFAFDRVEEIAEAFGVDKNTNSRIGAGITYVLKRNLQNGHTCLPGEKLITVSASLLGCETETVKSVLDTALETFILNEAILDGVRYIFLPEYFKAERYISARILAMLDFSFEEIPVTQPEIDLCEAKFSIEFDKKQRDAIKAAIENGMLILTGGPGTGKTTTLNAIIKILKQRDLSVVLAAPTGRAAQRITELTGCEAKTIHRLLEAGLDDNRRNVFARNEKNKLDCDAIIIDEMSMVDSLLFEALLRALRLDCRIIMVGDSDQLPSVSAGNILNDLTLSDIIPYVRLDKVFRQAAQSEIVQEAHMIIEGKGLSFENSAKSDCFFIAQPTSYETVETVVDLVCNRLPKVYNYSPIEDIQVLSPSRKMDCGTMSLNSVLQDKINPKLKTTEQLNFMGGSFRVGDRVMQTENNYDIFWQRKNGEAGTGVFNGDIGVINGIDKRQGTMTVLFDDKIVEYFTDDLKQLELAYAVTVHKSQGSEFDCVVIPLFDVPNKLRYRNLIYTAVTRAKKMLVIVGKPSVIAEMVSNNKKTLRYTALKHFLTEVE